MHARTGSLPAQVGPPPISAEIPILENPPRIRRRGARRMARDLAAALGDAQAEAAHLRGQLQRLGALDLADLADLERRHLEAENELRELQQRVVDTAQTAALQAAGVYLYRHPLEDSVAYQGELARLRHRIAAMALRESATVTGSELGTLLLRGYNAEADLLVLGVQPDTLAQTQARLARAAETIERLSGMAISPGYQQLRQQELELTADHRHRLAAEREREQAERSRLRAENAVRAELGRERNRLLARRQHWNTALAALEARADLVGMQRLRTQILDAETSVAELDRRCANARAGYVYVVSNPGALGPGMVTVGLTRRLDPLDRIRELGSGSVPYPFELHALFFAADAVGLVDRVHDRLAGRRVNRADPGRGFFYATPAEVRDHLLALAPDLVQFTA